MKNLKTTFIEEDYTNLEQYEIRKSTEEIQNLVLALLNKTIAEKLTSSILSLRETYLGTLQRYLLFNSGATYPINIDFCIFILVF